jgi:hypothetical protein
MSSRWTDLLADTVQFDRDFQPIRAEPLLCPLDLTSLIRFDKSLSSSCEYRFIHCRAKL